MSGIYAYILIPPSIISALTGCKVDSARIVYAGGSVINSQWSQEIRRQHYASQLSESLGLPIDGNLVPSVITVY